MNEYQIVSYYLHYLYRDIFISNTFSSFFVDKRHYAWSTERTFLQDLLHIYVICDISQCDTVTLYKTLVLFIHLL